MCLMPAACASHKQHKAVAVCTVFLQGQQAESRPGSEADVRVAMITRNKLQGAGRTGRCASAALTNTARCCTASTAAPTATTSSSFSGPAYRSAYSGFVTGPNTCAAQHGVHKPNFVDNTLLLGYLRLSVHPAPEALCRSLTQQICPYALPRNTLPMLSRVFARGVCQSKHMAMSMRWTWARLLRCAHVRQHANPCACAYRLHWMLSLLCCI
jgi:hypothetical protein